MKKDKKDSGEDLEGLISISEAARVRSVSHAAIQDLIKREKLSSIEIGGRRFLRRDEVEGFSPESVGRPPKSLPTTQKTATGHASASNGGATGAPKATKKGGKK
jgi:excisionase family DNA binding protein